MGFFDEKTMKKTLIDVENSSKIVKFDQFWSKKQGVYTPSQVSRRSGSPGALSMLQHGFVHDGEIPLPHFPAKLVLLFDVQLLDQLREKQMYALREVAVK